MKQIKIKSLSLFNFKGIENLDLQFQDENYIYGDNATGKTTIFDAFTWVLFGKDSSGRADTNFNICPLGENGKPILGREPFVECILTVNGSPIKLGRKRCEVWTKPRGTTEETLTGYKTEFFVNDVKLPTKRDYDAEVSAILSEDLFKILTNPFYFTSLNADTQKEMLFRMSGGISDEEVAVTNNEFAEMLVELQGKPLERHLKEVAAKKRAINDELKLIPASIETAQRLMPEELDWATIEKELTEKKAKIAKLDAQISDRSEIAKAESQKRVDIQKSIGDKKYKLVQREQEVKTQAMAEINANQNKISEIGFKMENLKNKKASYEKEQSICKERISNMEKRLETLREEFRSINSMQLEYPEGAFSCYACNRPLEPADINAKQLELENNFNTKKAVQLEENKKQGINTAKERDAIRNMLQEWEKKATDIQLELEKLEIEQSNLKKQTPETPDIDKLILEDTACIVIKNDIQELEKQLAEGPKIIDNSELIENKNLLTIETERLVRSLGTKDQRERAKEEIEKLENKRVAANQQLAELEKIEFVATNFQKAKDAMLQEKINKMFSLVSFSFVKEQLNSGEKITCICMVNGTPYPDANNAGKVNAGLDIINAICKSEGVTAPIFFDNRESVNELIPTLSQIINLVVSKDKKITQR